MSKLIQITEKGYKQSTHKRVREGYRRYLDGINQLFGAIRPFKLYRDTSTRVYFYKVQCKCGNKTLINANAIVQAGQKYCGNDCVLKIKETNKNRRYSNGQEGYKITFNRLKKKNRLPKNLDWDECHRLITIWKMMLKRCGYIGSTPEANYAGRGIKVYAKWLDSPWNFIKCVGPRPSTQHSIDRKDNNGNYEPKNIRWATRSEQIRNSRKVLNSANRDFNKIFSYRGEFNTRVVAVYDYDNQIFAWRIKCGACNSLRYLKRFNANRIRQFVIACRCKNSGGGIYAHTSLKALVNEKGFNPKKIKKYTPANVAA